MSTLDAKNIQPEEYNLHDTSHICHVLHEAQERGKKSFIAFLETARFFSDPVCPSARRILE